MDMGGRCIRQGTGYTISTENIQDGIYFCTMESSEYALTQKIIIAH